MSVIYALKRTPKGQLSYERDLIPDKLNNELGKYSSPPLSGPHIEREFSLLNLSFGLDPSSFNNDSISPATNSLNNSKNDCNNSQSETTSRRELKDYRNETMKKNLNNSNDGHDLTADVKSSPKGFKMSKAEALAELDCETEIDTERINQVNSDEKDSLSSPSSVTCGNDEHNKSAEPNPMLTQYCLTSCAILEEDKRWNLVAKEAMRMRCRQFEDHEQAMKFLMKQKEDELNKRINCLVNQRETFINQSQQESKVRAHARLLKIKEGLEEHQKKIVTKHQEIQRQREKIEEEERKRRELELAKLNQLRSIFKECEDNKALFVKLRESFEFKDKLSEMIDKCLAAFDKSQISLSEQLAESEKTQSVPVDRITKFLSHRDQGLQYFELLKQQIESVRKEMKEKEAKEKEAEQKKIEAEKQEEQRKKEENTLDFGIQSMAYVVKDKEAKLKVLADTNPVVQAFTSNVQMKKYRFELQKAVNTPINAISAVSGSHLRDKLQILNNLLSGQQVQVAGKQVSAGQSPEGIAFCQNLVAKMLVKKGEEQVTSNHESAFAIAAVAVGLWVQFPAVGDLFLSHLQAICPYVLPFYSIRQDGQSTQDYHKSMGYKIDEDGAIEEQDKFLHRMSGVMRLYCACMVATPPKGLHPHGVEHAWMWLCRTLNMEPQPDITAAMIFDVLSVTGHSLFMAYKIQFAKLLYLIYKSYLPKMKQVSVTNSTVGRLEIFLEYSLQNNAKIDSPKGLLPPNFWFS